MTYNGNFKVKKTLNGLIWSSSSFNKILVIWFQDETVIDGSRRYNIIYYKTVFLPVYKSRIW